MRNYWNDLIRRGRLVWATKKFCSALLFDNEMIKGNSFVPRIQGYLGKHVDFEEFQQKIIENRKAEIPNKNIILDDATCYEVYIRFPTDVKPLWESCEWLWAMQISAIFKLNKLKEPRSKTSAKNI